MDILTEPGRRARPSWAVYVRWRSGKLERFITTAPARIATTPDCQVLAAAILPVIVIGRAVRQQVDRR
jgi:hypothetical protein